MQSAAASKANRDDASLSLKLESAASDRSTASGARTRRRGFGDERAGLVRARVLGYLGPRGRNPNCSPVRLGSTRTPRSTPTYAHRRESASASSGVEACTSTTIGPCAHATVQIPGLGSGANVDVGGGLAPAPVFETERNQSVVQLETGELEWTLGLDIPGRAG
jgi:hypothetical protein